MVHNFSLCLRHGFPSLIYIVSVANFQVILFQLCQTTLQQKYPRSRGLTEAWHHAPKHPFPSTAKKNLQKKNAAQHPLSSKTQGIPFKISSLQHFENGKFASQSNEVSFLKSETQLPFARLLRRKKNAKHNSGK